MIIYTHIIVPVMFTISWALPELDLFRIEKCLIFVYPENTHYCTSCHVHYSRTSRCLTKRFLRLVDKTFELSSCWELSPICQLLLLLECCPISLIIWPLSLAISPLSFIDWLLWLLASLDSVFVAFSSCVAGFNWPTPIRWIYSNIFHIIKMNKLVRHV